MGVALFPCFGLKFHLIIIEKALGSELVANLGSMAGVHIEIEINRVIP